jgi:hypothetical protein
MCAVTGAAPCILGGAADPQQQALFLIECGLHHRNTDDWYNHVAVAADRAPGWDAHYWGPGFIGWDSKKTFKFNVARHFPKTKLKLSSCIGHWRAIWCVMRSASIIWMWLYASCLERRYCPQ